MSIDVTKLLENPVPIIENSEDQLRNFILFPKIFEPKNHYHPRDPQFNRLYSIPSCPESTKLYPKRNPTTNEIINFVEVHLEDAGSTAKNSMSLQRAPGPAEQATRGSAMNFPFWPGGFDESKDEILRLQIDNTDFEENLLSIVPGFSEGMEFGTTRTINHASIDLLSVLDDNMETFDVEISDHMQNSLNEKNQIQLAADLDDTLLLINKQDSDVLNIKDMLTKNNIAEWAEIIDISQPVTNFNERISGAQKYPFELDTFQKQAILKLEEHKHVFVAAHTSAGKTVVAEYAIALSKKHMTKAIYTSPIKALSNQKYRDFKQIFGDVGLITGDLQIDSTANCLIMTTEILRSMLYCGSDVTRDLEYVIFDEVHYITDANRGHVWEEVLILLPSHVCIVMLSATVPNTLEFSNWVGKTKRKKVYVISTAKRPVPLCHYLYTGNGGKSRDDIFQIVNENGKFNQENYEKAKLTKVSRQKDFKKNYGSHTSSKLNPKQEQTMWVGLIDHLKRNNKLPVVAFTLSRNRCDNNAEALRSCDLCNAREKFKIHSFFQLCLQKLKPPDRELPQVKTIQSCLERGIGVHHSGILPILKEIVEMLFQCGLVKLLFATETFAMGVNMPAKTVIFDSCSKFDGVQSRTLQAAEYTQMAGRAGRRGLDDTGTVIILCKSDITHDEILKQMILGKPMKLESKFRLTYSMILSLLRVERVTVEDMMSHSFREFGKQLKVPQNEEQLKQAEEKLMELSDVSQSEFLVPLCDFYKVCRQYLDVVDLTMPKLIGQQKIFNELRPGKVLKISYFRHYNKLGVLLSVSATTQKETTFKVLVLDPESNEEHKLMRSELWHRMMSLSYKYKNFDWNDQGFGHTIISIQSSNIVEITKVNLKCETDKIVQNWEQRQIPRFRDNPPSQSVLNAIEELKKLCLDDSLEILPFVSQNLELVDEVKKMKDLKDKVLAQQPFTNRPTFEDDFAFVFDRKNLEEKKESLQYQLSSKNLSLYPDYCNKLLVLQNLKYIDDMHQVAMKGRVACEMGQNELIITELVLRNILTNLQPAEIAALLSSLVFQAKSNVDPTVPENLKEMMVAFVEVDNDIRRVEAQFNVSNDDESVAKDKLNFGLIEVVYEWAQNKPFAEIMQLTDIKEGVIVRCIQQLNETLRDVKDAARIIGDPVLHAKMEEASNAIKRDIVFAASLYTSSDILNINNN